MTALDWTVMAAYGGVVLALGTYFARQQRDAADYFLGRHQLPWWTVMFSVVATETSALSVISVPGIGARSDLGFLQLAIGYLIGRIGVAAWLLPGYFHGEQETAYARLEARFGPQTRRLASGIFMVIRAMGDSVRVFATAIPLAIVTGWTIPASVIAVVFATLIYTWAGGLRAVVWTDLLQLGLYVLGAVLTLAVAAQLAGGADVLLPAAREAGKLRIFDFRISLSAPYTFLGAVVGGAMLSAASHGTDHLMVQRLLATKNLESARKALVGSGLVVVLQFALFLLVGTALWGAGIDDGISPSDELYPRFIVEHLPAGLAGLVVAGLLAAAMSTVSSSLNSLASASTHDFYAPLSRRNDPRHLLAVGRWMTLAWAGTLAVGALSFSSDEQPVVELALSIASITYGALLGTYILAGIAKRVTQRDVILAMLLACSAMLVVVLFKPGPLGTLAWPWYVPLGTLITVVTGIASSWLRN
ncbi:MAG: sodium:solute symporter [Gemmatimonadales bacterium]|nr:MAG: sodium:solute symporter [Gemmatimonadales bacterium]